MWRQTYGVIALAIALEACGRGRSATEHVPSSAATVSVSAAPTASVGPSAITTPSAAPSARTPQAEQAEKVLMSWNAAENRHSIDDLRVLYAAEVMFYGQRWTLQQVLDAKRKAFEKEPDFRQRLKDVKVEQRDERISITFEKRSGKALKAVYGSLELEQRPDGLKIVDESDEATDAKLRPRADTCPDAAMTIATSESIIQADIERVAREFPDVNPGGMSYDQTGRTDRYSGSLGYFHPERYEPRWFIEAAAGKLTIRDAYSDALLPVTGAQRALIQRLCTGKGDDASDGALR
jgi:hypothetical protein